MYKLPAMYVGEYAERDAEATLKLWQRLSVELLTKNLWMCLTWRQNYFLV